MQGPGSDLCSPRVFCGRHSFKRVMPDLCCVAGVGNTADHAARAARRCQSVARRHLDASSEHCAYLTAVQTHARRPECCHEFAEERETPCSHLVEVVKVDGCSTKVRRAGVHMRTTYSRRRRSRWAPHNGAVRALLNDEAAGRPGGQHLAWRPAARVLGSGRPSHKRHARETHLIERDVLLRRVNVEDGGRGLVHDGEHVASRDRVEGRSGGEVVCF
jgi:hypothetical protein